MARGTLIRKRNREGNFSFRKYADFVWGNNPAGTMQIFFEEILLIVYIYVAVYMHP